MKNKNFKKTILAAMFMAIGFVLPFFTGQIKQIGNKLLPMHIPVLLCGLICGWQYGLLVGVLLPIMRSLIFSMPIMYPNAIAMAFELATYGFAVGIIYCRLKKQNTKTVYISMIASMICGRIVWGIAEVILLGIKGNAFTLSAFIAGAFVNSVLGIILQLILIPIIMATLNRAKLITFNNNL